MRFGVQGSIWLVTAAVGLVLTFWNPFAGSAAAFNRDVTVASAAIYATLRSANAVMSVLKDADVQGSIGIASVSGSPGQILQPITNTIDRMAGILFALAIAAGVLSTVMGPVASGAALILAGGAVLRLAAALPGLKIGPRIQPVARSLVLVGTTGALMLPGAYAAAFILGDRITATAWENASIVMARLDATYDQRTVEEQLQAPDNVGAATELSGPEPVGAEPEQRSLFGRGKQALGAAIDSSSAAIQGTVAAASSLASSVTSDLQGKTEAIRTAFSISNDLFIASIQIAVSYIVKLIVLPTIIIIAGWFVLRSGLRADL